MKHTPGPWTINATRTHILRDAPRETICSVFGGHESMNRHVTSETQEANARLIAAAPDLLQACHQLCQTIGLTPVDDVQQIIRELKAGYDLARIAIAKAEGRS